MRRSSDRAGHVLGAARVPDPKWEDTGDELHLDSIASALEAAARDAGLDPQARPVANLGVYCLAGADLPVDDRRILRGLRTARLHRARTCCATTRSRCCAQGRSATWGVGIVCGFGTNCSGIAPDGRHYRLPAIGGISGDWGGAAELGEYALWHALRARDGRGPRTSLARSVPEHFGLRTPRQVMEALYFRRLEGGRLAELAPVLFRDAATDEVARGLVDRQADEIVLMAEAAIRRLGMRALDVDVVLGGGIFRNRFPPFFERIEAGLHQVAERARIAVLSAPPVVGAAMLALDRIGASGPAKARTRADLTHDRLAKDARRGPRKG